MPLTLLLDLDDTLLDTHVEAFLPIYYKALADYLESKVPPADLMSALRSGIGNMLANEDPSRTLQDVFEADFYPRLTVPKDELRIAIQEFYRSVFPTLRSATRLRPGASELVDWALDQGHQLAIATDPVFPRAATIERVRWAGLQPSQFDLISSFETFHFTKSKPAFLAEFAGRLGWPDRSIVMAGNDAERDLAPAAALGFSTFRVNGAGPEHGAAAHIRSGESTPASLHGDLGSLRNWLMGFQSGGSGRPRLSKQGTLAMLLSTPAVLHGLTRNLDSSTWRAKTSVEDWALIELVCHLRDTEREVHLAQIEALVSDPQPFVPRPDAAVWAAQRRYLDEDGPAALEGFAQARQATLRRLGGQPDAIWSKSARHAIFGPTTFSEVIGFMADHDRMHVQQAWNTLAVLEGPAHRN